MSGLGDHSPGAMREPWTSHCEAVRVVRRPLRRPLSAALDLRTEEMKTPERMAMTWRICFQ